MRSAIEEAQRQLGAQSRNLLAQWRRSVTLGDTTRLLRDIAAVCDAPQRVQAMEDSKAWHPHCNLGLSILCRFSDLHFVFFLLPRNKPGDVGIC